MTGILSLRKKFPKEFSKRSLKIEQKNLKIVECKAKDRDEKRLSFE